MLNSAPRKAHRLAGLDLRRFQTDRRYKSAPAAPAAPDPVATANAQGAANVDTAVAQSQLNQVNQSTPYGSVNYSQTGTTSTPDGTAIPQYTQTTTLNPTEQNTLTQQQQLADTLAGYGNTLPSQLPTSALSFADAPALQSSVNTSGVTPLSNPSDFGAETTAAQQAAYNQAYGLVQPSQAYAKEQLNSSLANAGIPQGSEAYNNAQNLLSTQQTAQNNNLAQGAVATGNSEQQALANEALGNNQAGFNEATTQAQLGNAARAQSTGEAQTLQNQPFNELSALIQGSPAIGTPSAGAAPQSSISPTDVLGANSLSQSAKNTAYQGNLANTNANNQAAAGTAASAAMIAAMLL